MRQKYKDNSLYNFSTTRSLLWFVLTPLAVAGFIVTLLLAQINVLIQNSTEIIDAQTISSVATKIRSLALEMQSSSRGYLMVGEEDYLTPFSAAINQFDTNLETLKRQLSEQNDTCTNCENVQMLKNEWLNLITKKISQKRHNKALKVTRSELNKTMDLMDGVYVFLDQTIQNQSQIILQKQANSEIKIKDSVARLVFFSILIAAVFSWATYHRISKLKRDSLLIVDDLKRAKDDLEITNTHLESIVAERTEDLRATNAELEAFCYSVSHDLRAPLRGIDGFSLALNEEYNSKIDSTGQRYLQFIRIGVQKMGRIIDDLLNLSRITRQNINKEEVDLSEIASTVIDDLVKDHPESADERIDRKIFHLEKNLNSFADPRLMHVVFENLLSNAWKFSSKKQNPKIIIGQTEVDHQKCFYIKDNGAGFDMSFKQKLFNPFQRLHSESEFQGTGIGLATVNRVILKHGGKIWADSKLDQGAVFYFSLPERNLDV